MPPIQTKDSSPQMALVDSMLRKDHGTDLEHYLAGRRSAGKSFDAIARDLEGLLDVEGFSVTYGTIRRWCIRLGIEEQAS